MAKNQNTNEPANTAVIYARYSSHNQREESIEQQVSECAAYARAHDLNVIDVYSDEKITGKTDKRPAFQRMMRNAEKGQFNCIIAYKSNRIARNLFNALSCEDKLNKLGVRVVYVKEEFGDNAAGRFALRTMMNVNQFYIENMAEDIRRGMLDSARQCKVIASLPFGYIKGEDDRYAIDENTAPIVREIFTRVASRESQASIAADLNARGIRTSSGGQWNKHSFHRMLSNERYLGVYIYDTIRIEHGIPQIIDTELFNAVRDLRNAKYTTFYGRHTKYGYYALTGKLFCGHCKSRMNGVSGISSSNGLSYHYYACCKRLNEKSCDKKPVRRDLIESLVAESLVDYILHDDTIEWIADMVMDYAKRFREENTEIDYLQDKLYASRKSSANILKAIEAGIFNSQTQERMIELDAEQRDLAKRIEEQKALLPDITRDQLVFWLQSLRNGDIGDSKFRLKLFSDFLESVYLYDDHINLFFKWDSTDHSIDIPSDSLLDNAERLSDTTSLMVRLLPPGGHQKFFIRTSAKIVMIGRYFVLTFSYEQIAK